MHEMDTIKFLVTSYKFRQSAMNKEQPESMGPVVKLAGVATLDCANEGWYDEGLLVSRSVSALADSKS